MHLDDLRLKAATDEDFRARLVADPRPLLAEAGVNVPDDIPVNIVVNDMNTAVTIAIAPLVDDPTNVDDEALAHLAAGYAFTYTPTAAARHSSP